MISYNQLKQNGRKLPFVFVDKVSIIWYNRIKAQGDVVAIRNESGVDVVRYKYDAWGITLSKARGEKASTYGAGFTLEIGKSPKKGISIGKMLFGSNAGHSYYIEWPLNKNSKELYDYVRNRTDK